MKGFFIFLLSNYTISTLGSDSGESKRELKFEKLIFEVSRRGIIGRVCSTTFLRRISASSGGLIIFAREIIVKFTFLF